MDLVLGLVGRAALRWLVALLFVCGWSSSWADYPQASSCEGAFGSPPTTGYSSDPDAVFLYYEDTAEANAVHYCVAVYSYAPFGPGGRVRFPTGRYAKVDPPPSCSQGNYPGVTTYHFKEIGQVSSSYCVDNCEFKPNGPQSCQEGSFGFWKVECFTPGGVRGTGQSCSMDPNDQTHGQGTTPDANGNCPSNTSAGTINGTRVCLAKDPGGSNTPNCTGGQVPVMVGGILGCGPPSTTSTSSETTTTNPDGSTTTTKTTTTCAGGSCTTTTTVGGKNADGTDKAPQTTTDSKSKDEYCKNNPRAPSCVVGSANFGDCVTPPSCDGDAIACAIASEVHRDRCAAEKDRNDTRDHPLRQFGSDLGAGNDPEGESLPSRSSTGSVVEAWDPGSTPEMVGGGGHCIPDQTITVFGHAFTVGTADVCSKLDPLRNVILVIGGLVALGIFVRGVS